jgi:uncharacterized membrane protein
MHPSRLRDVEVSVDDALKFHVSMGVVPPGNGRVHRSALTTEGPGVPG